MSTIALCWYALGWAFVGTGIKNGYEEELDLLDLVSLIARWPIATAAVVIHWLLSPLLNRLAPLATFVVWRRK